MYFFKILYIKSVYIFDKILTHSLNPRARWARRAEQVDEVSPLHPVLSDVLSVSDGEAEFPQVRCDSVSPAGPGSSAGAAPPGRCRVEVIDDAGWVVG